MADRHCLQRVEILRIEGRGLLKPLWRIVVASSGPKSITIEDLGCFLASTADPNSQELKILDFVKPLGRAVVASGESKSTWAAIGIPGQLKEHLVTWRLGMPTWAAIGIPGQL